MRSSMREPEDISSLWSDASHGRQRLPNAKVRGVRRQLQRIDDKCRKTSFFVKPGVVE